MRFLIVFFLVIGFSSLAYAETPYERVMKTGIIRCGYILWPPYMDKDITSGNFKGLNFDYMEKLAESLGLKVEWAVEIMPGLQVETLRSGKADAICSAEGPMMPKTSSQLIYTRPINICPFDLYVRPDEKRFIDKAAINKPNVKIAVLEEDASDIISRIHFPLAERMPVPPNAISGQMMMDVISKKSDVLIMDPLTMAEFFKNNHEQLKKLPLGEPVAVIPMTLSVLRPSGRDLADLLNQGMNNMQNYGMDEAIFKRYEAQYEGEIFYRPALPYKDE
ncbi:MAG: transporter substrate-binding domain-containing protein [Alphaproteobacteria bacterium]|nr:transporter substrate-binding domain-containing protein [Alphaproteobacteria bacterium]